MDCRRLQLGVLGLVLSLLPGTALAGVVDQVQLAREAIVAGDLKGAVKALDAAQKSAPSEGAVVPPRLLAQLYFYRGVVEHKSGDKKGLALDAWRQALIVENGFAWDVEVLAEDDPRSVFEALRAEVRSRPKVETWVPEKTGLARLYVDGQQRSANAQVLEGLHLAQIECPDGAVYGLWTDLRKDPRWFKLCPGGVDTSVEPAVASTEEDEWGDFAPVFGATEGPVTGEPATGEPAAPVTIDPARAKAEAEAKKQADAEAKKKADAEAAAAAKAKADAEAKALQEAAAAKAAQEAAAAKAAQEAAAAKAIQDAAAAKAAQDAAAAKAAQDAAAAKAAQDAAAAKAAQDAAASAQDAAAAKAAQDAAAAKAAAEEDARKKAESEAIAAQTKAAEEAERKKAEEQARRMAENEARKKADERAKAKSDEGGPRVLTRPTEPAKADEPVADAAPTEKPDKADPPPRAIDSDAGMRSGKSKRGGPLGGILLGTGGAALAGATTYYFVSFAPNYSALTDARDNPVDRASADELESRHDSRRYTVLGLGALGLVAGAAGGVVIALDADLPVRAFVGWGSVGLGGRF